MNVAKYLLLALLMLPLAELAAFIAVAVAIGFFAALGLVIAGSFAGLLILQHAGGNHIARMRVALGEGSFTSLQADGTGTAHPAGRNSLADSGVYNGCRGPAAAAGAAAPGARRGASTRTARRPPTAWSISSRSSGTGCPTPHCPTGAERENR